VSMFDPFADLTRLRQQIDRMVQESAPQARPEERGRVWRPAVDVFEDEDAVTVNLDLPGVDRETIDIQVTSEELVITGERKWVAPEKGGCVHSERPHGQFHRAFRLGIPVDHEGVQASFRDGVLTVRLPKSAAVKPRKVAIQTDTQG
jgi:HSP20 family protein